MSRTKAKCTSSRKPLVSIVVCFLNPRISFLREALESVQRQTYNHWELVLVDDGSTRSGTNFAKQFARRNDRVRYFEHEEHRNIGLPASRNAGVRYAEGKYVGFLDADDVFLARKIEEQVEAMESHPKAALSYGGLVRWHSWNTEGGKVDKVERRPVTDPTLLTPPDLVLRLLENKDIPGACGLLARRDVVLEVGGFAESVQWSEDQTVVYKIALQHPVLMLPQVQWKYRQHDEAWSATKDGNIFSQHLEFLKWVQRYLDEQGIEDDRIWDRFYDLKSTYRKLAWKKKLTPKFVKIISSYFDK